MTLRHGPTIKDQSLAEKLAVGQDNTRQDRGKTTRVHNEDLEPLWVTHLRGEPLGVDDVSGEGVKGAA